MTAQSKTFVESVEARWRAIGRRGWANAVSVLWAKANSEGGLNETLMDLSRITGFVPAFRTKSHISEKLSVELKTVAFFVSKIHSRKGSVGSRCATSLHSYVIYDSIFP